MSFHPSNEAVPFRRQPALSDLDWRVVEMARADGRHSLNPDGFWASTVRKIFGISVARPLANEGLEALRRFSVRAWHWNHVRPSDVGMLIDRGYSRAAALEVLAHIASRRGCMPCVQDDLLDIGSGPEGAFAPSSQPSGPVRTLPAPQARPHAPRCGWRLQLAGMRP